MWFPATQESAAKMLGIEVAENEQENDYGVPLLEKWEEMWRAWDGLMVRGFRSCSFGGKMLTIGLPAARTDPSFAALHQADPVAAHSALLCRPHPGVPRHPPLALLQRASHRAGSLRRHF